MSEENVQRLRIQFTKGEAIKYISHLDLAKTLERIWRRADLPMVFSQGFNPRPKIALASALPVGVSGQQELVDIWVAPPMEPTACFERISDETPDGLCIVGVTEAPLAQASLQSLVREAEYRITLDEPVADLPARIAALLAQDALPRERMRKDRVKEYDLRPLIGDIWLIAGQDNQFGMRLANSSSATGRTDEVLDALGLDALACRIERTRLIFSENV